MDYDARRTTISIALVVLVIFLVIIPANPIDMMRPSLHKTNSYNINFALAKKSGESNNKNSCISCFTSLLAPKQISALEHGLGVKSIQELCKQIETGDIGRADFYTTVVYLTDIPFSTDVQISKCLRNNGIEFAQ